MTPFAACIMDVDGVLVDSPHERASRETLASLMEGPWRDLRGRTAWAPDRFTGAVYQRVVAGRPRLDGARAALEHFEVPDAARRAEEYAAVKQRRVEELIEAGRFTAFDDAVRFVLALRAAGVPLAAASSSRNADALLSRVPAGPGSSLLDHFAVDESGRAFAHGKPAPDIFLAAAADLGVPRRRAWWWRTRRRASAPPRPAAWARSAWRATTTRCPCARPAPTWWFARSPRWTSPRLPRAS